MKPTPLLPLSQRLKTLLHPTVGMIIPRQFPKGYVHPRRFQYPHDRITDNRGQFALRWRDHGMNQATDRRGWLRRTLDNLFEGF